MANRNPVTTEHYTIRPAQMRDKEGITLVYKEGFAAEHPNIPADFKEDLAVARGRVHGWLANTDNNTTSPVFVVENSQGEVVAFAKSRWSYQDDALMNDTAAVQTGDVQAQFGAMRNNLIVLDKVYGRTEQAKDLARMGAIEYQLEAIPAKAEQLGVKLNPSRIGTYEINYNEDFREHEKSLLGAKVRQPDGSEAPLMLQGMTGFKRTTDKHEHDETPLVAKKAIDYTKFIGQRLEQQGVAVPDSLIPQLPNPDMWLSRVTMRGNQPLPPYML